MLLIVSGCTRDKAVHHPDHLTVEDFADPARFERREAALARLRTPAAGMYQGAEHRRTLAAIRSLRGAGIPVEHCIVSAGYGLLDEHAEVVPYDATFDTMTGTEADAWALSLGIGAALSRRLAGVTDAVFLLYPPYRRAVGPLEPASGQRFLWLDPDEDPLPAVERFRGAR